MNNKRIISYISKRLSLTCYHEIILKLNNWILKVNEWQTLNCIIQIQN